MYAAAICAIISLIGVLITSAFVGDHRRKSLKTTDGKMCVTSLRYGYACVSLGVVAAGCSEVAFLNLHGLVHSDGATPLLFVRNPFVSTCSSTNLFVSNLFVGNLFVSNLFAATVAMCADLLCRTVMYADLLWFATVWTYLRYGAIGSVQGSEGYEDEMSPP
jgi:hypothetical protein